MPSPDKQIARLAARQHSVFTRAQARSCGFSDDQIDRRLACGLWQRLHSSVFKIAGAPLTFEGRALAAVLAAGPGAAASHTTAAKLFRFERIESTKLHVTVPRSRRVQVRGVIVHQGPIACDATKVGCVPVTTPVRTLIDIAGLVPPDVLEDALDDIWRRHVVTPEGCLAALDRLGPRGRSGMALLRKLLAERASQRPSGSGRENATRRLLEAAGLPSPERQFVIRDDDGRELGRPDLAYPNEQIAIEFDSTKWHGSRESLHRDHGKQNRRSGAEWLVFLVDDDTLRHPSEFVDNVRRAYTRRHRAFLRASAANSAAKARKKRGNNP